MNDYEIQKIRDAAFCSGYNTAVSKYEKQNKKLQKENAELKKVAEFQQSSNMSRHFENKKLKEGLAVGSTFNKTLNSMNKSLEGERDKYRNMVFDLQKENAELKAQCDCEKCYSLARAYRNDNEKQKEQLTKAKEIIKNIIRVTWGEGWNYSLDWKVKAEQFLSEVEK